MAVGSATPEAGNGPATEDDRASPNFDGGAARVLYLPDEDGRRLRDENAELKAQLRIQDEQNRLLRGENALYKGWLGYSPASYTEGRKVRFMQWNLQWLTKGGEVQGALWGDRLENVVNTILFCKPDVVAIEEVKASENGLEAFKEIRNALEEHGYWGECSSQTTANEDNTKNPECVGLIWRTRLVPTGAAQPVSFIRLVGPNKPEVARTQDVQTPSGDTVAAAVANLGVDDVVGAVEDVSLEFKGAFGEETQKQDFDRHLVLATLQTNLGQPLHVLIGHLDTKKTGNQAGVEVIKRLAWYAWVEGAWDKGAWLVIMADTNTDEAGNKDPWDDLDSLGGTRALPPEVQTCMYPFSYAGRPKRNDEILIPKSWTLVSAETAPVCPAALDKWARDAPGLYSSPRKMNQRLWHRTSDHRGVVLEAELPRVDGPPAIGYVKIGKDEVVCRAQDVR